MIYLNEILTNNTAATDEDSGVVVSFTTYQKLVAFFGGDEQLASDEILNSYSFAIERFNGDFRRAARLLKLRAAVLRDIAVTARATCATKRKSHKQEGDEIGVS